MLHGIAAWDIARTRQREALRCADCLLAVSSFTRGQVIRNEAFALGQCELLPNTVDTTQYTPGPKPGYLQSRYSLPEDARGILTVGRLDRAHPYKGQDRVIEALDVVQEHLPAVRYLLVGEGDDRRRLEHLAAECGVRNAVIFAGGVDTAE